LSSIPIAAYGGNQRAGLIERHAWSDPAEGKSYLYVCAPDVVADHIFRVGGTTCVSVAVPSGQAGEYSHCFAVPESRRGILEQLAALLSKCRALVLRPPMELGMALDWYKVPDPEVDPRWWQNTPAGNRVSRGKYWSGEREGSLEKLSRAIAVAIQLHPAFAATTSILSVPGSDGTGSSFGEELARMVADRCEIPLIVPVCVHGARTPRKNGGQINDGDFRIDSQMAGAVLVVDDVYQSGATMAEVARAALESGAVEVYGMTAVRTMRN
jgi:hypothetical protein